MEIVEWTVPPEIWDDLGETPGDMPFLMYSAVDFREWSEGKILLAWDNCLGSEEYCANRVASLTTYPRVYAKLLSTAVGMILYGRDSQNT